VACYAQDDPSLDEVVSVLAELGVAPWPVPSSANAADKALLQHAHYVHQRGGRVFIVASGDRQFAALASLGRLEVLAWEKQPVARALANAAGSHLRRLPAPSTDSSSPVTAIAVEAPEDVARPEEAFGSHEAGEQHRHLGRSTDQGFPVGGRPCHGYLHAVLTGIGIGVGERLTATALARRGTAISASRRRERA